MQRQRNHHTVLLLCLLVSLGCLRRCTGFQTNLSRRTIQPPTITIACESPQHAPSLSQRSSSLALFAKQQHQNNSNPRQRRRSKRKLLRRLLTTLTFGLSLCIGHPLSAVAQPAQQETKTISIRPGMTLEQAEKAASGELDDEALQQQQLDQHNSKQATETTKTKKKVATKKKSSYYYDDEMDEDGEDFLEDEYVLPPSLSAASNPFAAKVAGKKTKSQFATGTMMDSNAKKALSVKVGLFLFVPTMGGMWTREYLRRGREELYVKKGLAILEAQRAEYFNVTGAVAADADVEDEIKKLKKNATKTDDDEDDDDDEYDDDEDENEDTTDRRRSSPGNRPKRPSGNDGGGSSSSGPSSDLGYGKASDDDIDKLKNLFGKS